MPTKEKPTKGNAHPGVSAKWPISPSVARKQFICVWRLVLRDWKSIRSQDQRTPDPSQQLKLAERCPASHPLWTRLCRMPIGCYYLVEQGGGVDFELPADYVYDSRTPGALLEDPRFPSCLPPAIWYMPKQADRHVVALAARQPDNLLPYLFHSPRFLLQQLITFWRARQCEAQESEIGRDAHTDDLHANLLGLLASLDQSIRAAALRLSATNKPGLPFFELRGEMFSAPPVSGEIRVPYHLTVHFLGGRDGKSADDDAAATTLFMDSCELSLRHLVYAAFLAGRLDHEAIVSQLSALTKFAITMDSLGEGKQKKGGATKRNQRAAFAQAMARLYPWDGQPRTKTSYRTDLASKCAAACRANKKALNWCIRDATFKLDTLWEYLDEVTPSPEQINKAAALIPKSFHRHNNPSPGSD